MPSLIIAIDGPSGAGKGTVARAIATRLGYRHLDTGAMYRAVAWKAVSLGVALDDEEKVAAIARTSDLKAENGLTEIDAVNISREIRTPAMDRAAAAVARLPKVRQALVRRQREYDKATGLVMEGRDIGTVVFPEAAVKIYLDATPEERARRRATDPAHSEGHAGGLPEVASALEARDRSDQTRPVSPLMVAPDAEVIDTTGLSIEAVVERVLEVVRTRTGIADSGFGIRGNGV
jgi:cytidylate kinase